MDLYNQDKLNVNEILKYFAQNFCTNIIQNQFMTSTTIQQKLVFSVLHYCGISIKIASIIILFL